MGKYSFDADNGVESSKACGSSLRAHFKQCREVCHAIKGMKVSKSIAYLEDVLQYKQAIPFTKFTGGIGRHAQGKLRNTPGDKVRWPQKATKIVLDLVKNAEANAEMKGLDVEDLMIKHSQANRAFSRSRMNTSSARERETGSLRALVFFLFVWFFTLCCILQARKSSAVAPTARTVASTRSCAPLRTSRLFCASWSSP